MRSRRFSSKKRSKLVIKRKRSQKKRRQYGGGKKAKSTKGKKKKKTTKVSGKGDANAPKRPMGAYMLWLQDNRQSIGDKYCSDLSGRDRVTSIAKKGGELWNAMTDEEKAPFTSKALKLHEAYSEQMKVYQTSVATVAEQDAATASATSATSATTAPYASLVDAILALKPARAGAPNPKMKQKVQAVLKQYLEEEKDKPNNDDDDSSDEEKTPEPKSDELATIMAAMESRRKKKSTVTKKRK